MNKFTAGPWHTEDKHSEWIFGADNYPMAYTTVECRDIETRKANAKLISASPDLLVALEAAEMWIIGTGSYIRHDAHAVAIRDVVKAALSKARGE